MTTVANNLVRINERIAAACARAGRPVDAVRLVAVSKLQPADNIRAAYAAGHRLFGENYGQELRDKARELDDDCPDMVWHFIGPVQSNKIRYIAPNASLVHTVERPDIALKLRERAERDGRSVAGLVEVNIAAEPQKSGVAVDEAEEQIRAIAASGLEVKGLMCMPPFGRPIEETRALFAKLRSLAMALTDRELLPRPCELSMGMSDDYEAAIEEGATLVRVGTAIFGPRGG